MKMLDNQNSILLTRPKPAKLNLGMEEPSIFLSKKPKFQISNLDRCLNFINKKETPLQVPLPNNMLGMKMKQKLKIAIIKTTKRDLSKKRNNLMGKACRKRMYKKDFWLNKVKTEK